MKKQITVDLPDDAMSTVKDAAEELRHTAMRVGARQMAALIELEDNWAADVIVRQRKRKAARK